MDVVSMFDSAVCEYHKNPAWRVITLAVTVSGLLCVYYAQLSALGRPEHLLVVDQTSVTTPHIGQNGPTHFSEQSMLDATIDNMTVVGNLTAFCETGRIQRISCKGF